jgi:hypothetical protein
MTVTSTRYQPPQLLQPECTLNSTTDKSNVKSSDPVGNVPRRRVVLFKETVSVRPITHMKDMSQEMIRRIWYDKKDFEKIKKGFAPTVRIMSHVDPKVDDDEHCSRGLEYRTRVGANARRELKWNALNAVLDEQDRQRAMGINNSDLLCQAYVAENRLSRLNALKLGIQDEDAAKIVYRHSSSDEMIIEPSDESMVCDATAMDEDCNMALPIDPIG